MDVSFLKDVECQARDYLIKFRTNLIAEVRLDRKRGGGSEKGWW